MGLIVTIKRWGLEEPPGVAMRREGKRQGGGGPVNSKVDTIAVNLQNSR